jgi:hypothetical protein
MAIRVLAGEPADEVAVDEIETEQSAAKETSSVLVDRLGFGRRRPRGAKDCDRRHGRVDTLIRIAQQERTRALHLVTITRGQERPEVMKNMDNSGLIGRSRTLKRDAAETITTSAMGLPGTGQPQGAADDTQRKSGSDSREALTIR